MATVQYLVACGNCKLLYRTYDKTKATEVLEKHQRKKRNHILRMKASMGER